MCVVSMVMDHYTDQWQRYKYVEPCILPTPKELEEFRSLLDRARKYDRTNHEPNCELEEKRKKLKDLAQELGVEIDFV